MSEAGKEPTGVRCPSRARGTALGMVPGAWGSAGGTAEAVLLGVVAPKIPPTLLLASLSPSWLSGHSLTKLRGCGVVGGPWLSPYHTHYSKGHSKGSDFAPWQWCNVISLWLPTPREVCSHQGMLQPHHGLSEGLGQAMPAIVCALSRQLRCCSAGG